MSFGQVIVPLVMSGSKVLSAILAPEVQTTDVPLILKTSKPPVQ